MAAPSTSPDPDLVALCRFFDNVGDYGGVAIDEDWMAYNGTQPAVFYTGVWKDAEHARVPYPRGTYLPGFPRLSYTTWTPAKDESQP